MIFDGSRLISVVLSACFETRNRDSGDLLLNTGIIELRYESKGGDLGGIGEIPGPIGVRDLGGRSHLGVGLDFLFYFLTPKINK